MREGRAAARPRGGTATWFEPGIKDGWIYLNNLRAGATTIVFR